MATHTVAYALKTPVSCDTCIVRTMFASRQSYCPPHAAHNQLQCHFLSLLFKLFTDTPSEIFHRKAAAMRSYVRHVRSFVTDTGRADEQEVSNRVNKAGVNTAAVDKRVAKVDAETRTCTSGGVVLAAVRQTKQ